MELITFVAFITGLMLYYFFYKRKMAVSPERISPEHKNLFIKYFEERGIENTWIYHVYYVLNEHPGLDHKIIKPDSKLVEDLNLSIMDCKNLLIDINSPLNRRLPSMNDLQEYNYKSPMITIEDFIAFAYQYK